MEGGIDSAGAREDRTAQLALLVDAITDYAIFLLDREGRITTWNAGAERAKGYTAEQIVGEHVSRFYTEEDRAAGLPERILETARREGSCENEGWRVRADGTRFWANVLVTALRGADGRHLGFGKVTRDLTAQQVAHVELERFASSAAHDLQEPLRTISGFVELLVGRHGAELSTDAREFVSHIAAASERMQGVIAGLLAYARSGAAEPELRAVRLSDAVGAALSALDAAVAARGVSVQVEVPPGAAVRADPAGLELVLQNLLGNAARFADDAGPRVAVRAERPLPTAWRVLVSDNGPGIDPAHHDRIFEPFVQLRRDDSGGTGLGLSICRRIVERLGGSIGVDSRPGAGSRFWVELRAADA